ncbi:HigA family addiction module antitoxin [Methylobacterium haplocladii]|uniref:HTH cro/C1-type domain-containing protein n=1 Tax=Methylobacterium haplocladii TaxID=1176176 RepID=A0A512IJW5_9HYPH|nr:HigA family addiction module antitoxin [Methylobacterium haplocladii]GEO97938.1 hypothetical protein MHA02_03260 [Methylobacterium haplocladii]GJD85985.1 Antitoxin HigA [Methylobacterium haplocladii]GLS58705.1 hypothetical protein GCM10007887_13690 [Methylobacterium haplocladii]
MTEITARRDPDRRPTHPGEILKDDILPALGLTIVDAAAHLGVTRQALHRLLAGTATLSPEMAVKLGKLTGSNPALLMRMQVAYDLWLAERNVDVRGIPAMKVA